MAFCNFPPCQVPRQVIGLLEIPCNCSTIKNSPAFSTLNSQSICPHSLISSLNNLLPPNLQKNHGDAPIGAAPNNPKKTSIPHRLILNINSHTIIMGTHASCLGPHVQNAPTPAVDVPLIHDWLDDSVSPVRAWQ